MKLSKTYVEPINAITSVLIGQKAWGVKLGVGSFITMEFGQPVPPSKDDTTIHGEWHFWVYCGVWRIETNGVFFTGSEDSRPKMEAALAKLEGRKLEDFKVLSPALDVVLKLDKGIILRLFSVNTEDDEHWMLFTPSKNVLRAGPGDSWSYEADDDSQVQTLPGESQARTFHECLLPA